MARVIAPFKIVGTIDDLTFFVDQQNVNRVKQKSSGGITKEQFRDNPIFQKVRDHGKEFGHCSKKSQSFRATALYFFKRAKDGSFAGRCNKLMLDIVYEDTSNPNGLRTVEKGMESPDSIGYFTGLEGNKMRPLQKVLKTKWSWDDEKNQFTIKSFNPTKHIDWPEKADLVHIAIAQSNWNYQEGTFNTEYSEEIIIAKDEAPQKIEITVNKPVGHHAELTYLFIGFSIQDRKRIKELPRINNTVSIIQSKIKT